MVAALKQRAQDYFKVHGGSLSRESMGDKMFQLYAKLDAILGADFGMVKRHILSMEFVKAYLRRCGAERAIIGGDFRRARKLIMDGKFTHAEMGLISIICKDLGDYAALLVRNSAFGDAAGSGMLGKSFYVENKEEAVARFVKRVIASYYALESVDFRKEAVLQEGLAVGIERLAGKTFEDADGNRCIAPSISGFGRTYSWFHKDAYIGSVYGLGSKFMTDPTEGWITKKMMLEYMAHYFRDDDVDGLDFSDADINRMAGKPKSREHPLVFKDGREQRIEKTIFPAATPIALFRKMERLSESKDSPLQFEYAIENERGDSPVFMNQIAEVQKRRIADFPAIDGKLLGESKRVLGSGGFDSEWIIRLTEKEGWGALREFNESHKKYIVIADNDSFFLSYSPIMGIRPGTTMSSTVLNSVKYADIRNFGLFATRTNELFSEISNHLQGTFESTGKVLTCINKIDFKTIELNAKEKNIYKSHQIYRLGASIRASECEQKCEIRLGK